MKSKTEGKYEWGYRLSFYHLLHGFATATAFNWRCIVFPSCSTLHAHRIGICFVLGCYRRGAKEAPVVAGARPPPHGSLSSTFYQLPVNPLVDGESRIWSQSRDLWKTTSLRIHSSSVYPTLTLSTLDNRLPSPYASVYAPSKRLWCYFTDYTDKLKRYNVRVSNSVKLGHVTLCDSVRWQQIQNCKFETT